MTQLRATMKKPPVMDFWRILLLVLLLATSATARQKQQSLDPSEAPIAAPVSVAPMELSETPVTSSPIAEAPVAVPRDSDAPVISPVISPVNSPVTLAPIIAPSIVPSPIPSLLQSLIPSSLPTENSSQMPSYEPSFTESKAPSLLPSLEPSNVPSTSTPTFIPSAAPATPSPTTTAPITTAPITIAPITTAPITTAPITSAPISDAPITPAPVSPAPVSPAPITPAPVIASLVTGAPVTTAPVSSLQFGDIAIRMLPVESTMNSDTFEVFRETVEFYLSKFMRPIIEISVEITSQLLLSDNTVEVGILVKGDAGNDPVDMGALALSIFAEYDTEFLELLQRTKNEYLKEITDVIPNDISTPSASPSMGPSSTESSAPSLTPTMSAPPSVVKIVAASDRFSIVLLSIATKMSTTNAGTLKTTTEEFLGKLYAQLEQPVNNITIQIVGQRLTTGNGRRQLQTLLPLEVEMTIEGTFKPKEGKTDPDLSQLSRNFFDTQSDEFVAMLREADEVEDRVYYANVNAVETVDELRPTPAPTPPGDSGGEGLALGAIIAIALCGAIAMTFVAALVCRRSRGNRAAASASMGRRATSNNNNTSSRRPSNNDTRLNLERGRSGSYDGDSVAESDMNSRMGTETLGGTDTMSYAYSLDHGIDPSISSGLPGDYMSGYASVGGAVPMEIPMLDDSNVEMGFDSSPGDKITRECFAPPGKLGIVIDTTSEGPIIHKVNPGSPLEGIVWPGDIIIAIDDADTRALSAGDITALMAKNTNQRRKLTILSDAS